MRRRSTRNHLAAIGLLGLFVVACSIQLAGEADARPLPAHHATAAFTDVGCLPSGAWRATFNVTADVPGGTAHVVTPASGSITFAVPGSYHFAAIDGRNPTYTVYYTVSWDDGFVTPSESKTAQRPTDGCVPPTTSTTTCEQAIPPRDCGGVTTTAPTVATTLPAETTTIPPTTAPSVEASTTVPGVATSMRRTTTTVCTPTGEPIGPGAVPCTLPTTGSSSTAVIFAGIGGLLVGAFLLFAGRRGVA